MGTKHKLRNTLFISAIIFTLAPVPVYGMHISEGFLQPLWAISWFLLSAPFVIYGFFSLREKMKRDTKLILLIAMAGAYSFVLSALKLPTFTGSCSHPTGVGLGAILFGPTIMSVIGVIVLLFQALLLAHGGVTTLGANTFSMGIVGPFVSFGIYHLAKRLKAPLGVCIFLAAFMGNLMTYFTTSVQLALAWPDAISGFSGALLKYLSIFAFTQLPIAVSEGLLTVIIFSAIHKYNRESIELLNLQ